MKICGCEDAEKGYVIINPDSPDRREILSLNPPVCREIISKSLDVDGQILTFKKEISSWNITPLAGGIRVEWGNGDIGILSGTSWNTSYLNEAFATWRQQMLSQFNPPSCSGSCKNGNLGVRFYGTTTNQVTITRGTATSDPCGARAVYTWRQDGNIIGVIEGFKYTPCDTRINVPNSWGNQNSVLSQSFSTMTFTGQSLRGIRITSDTGQISERITTTQPNVSLLAGGCGLVVNYADGSQSPILEFPQCPQNIKKIETLEVSDTGGILEQIAPAPSGEIIISCGERECPPETCFNCDCSELNCCYDENGRLIDSFIRRT